MMTLQRTGTAGAVGLGAGLLGPGLGTLLAGGAGVAGGILSVTAPATLPGIDAGLLGGGAAVLGYELAGTALLLGIVALLGIGTVVVVEAVERKGVAL